MNDSIFGIMCCCLNLIVCGFMLFKLPIDPLDNGLIINENAFYLSASHSEDFRTIMDLEEFK